MANTFYAILLVSDQYQDWKEQIVTLKLLLLKELALSNYVYVWSDSQGILRSH